ncbi:GGDEF domain-containing protein [Paenibacillus sp. NPDC058071]|uniref:GGDEF domain-containing protein n=1 Tax=Paenibacillus sp. NPDC058071 TaxID=3346326 RepID=UPI0036DC4E37
MLKRKYGTTIIHIEGIAVSDIGTGLFHSDLIRAIEKKRQHGGFGLLYMKAKCEDKADDQVIEQWEQEQKRLIWRQRAGDDYIGVFYGKQKDDPVLRIMDRASAALQARLAGRLLRVGMSQFHLPAKGAKVETELFSAFKEALFAADEIDRTNPRLEPALSISSAAYAIRQLAVPFPAFPSRMKVSEIADFFSANPKAPGAVITEEDRPVGLLMKEKLHQLLAGQFGLPLYWNRGVHKIMNDSPLIVEADMPVEQVSYLAMARDYEQLYEVVIIVEEGRLLGAATIRSILEGMTAMRTEAARTANPLTGLPGNEDIQLELDRRIKQRQAFAVIYADLDYFKWYNDCFGFGQGDALIRYLAELLQETKQQWGTANDFIGHIGGDDFIVVTDMGRAEQMCGSLIEKFDAGVQRFYGGLEVTEVEDRHGNRIEQEGVTLSLSLMLAEDGGELTPDAISRFSAKLKKRAKAIKGSVYVIDTLWRPQHREDRA